MVTPETVPEQKLNQLISLAKENTPESWEQIDKQKNSVCNDPDFLTWAKNNLFNNDSGLRDLAATLFEASDIILSIEDVQNLMRLMTTDDSYPGFRAACALAKRFKTENIKPQIDKIKEKLEEFTKDEDESVVKLAKEYLDSLN